MDDDAARLRARHRRLSAAVVAALGGALVGCYAAVGLVVVVQTTNLEIRLPHYLVLLTILFAPVVVASLVGWFFAESMLNLAGQLRRVLPSSWVL